MKVVAAAGRIVSAAALLALGGCDGVDGMKSASGTSMGTSYAVHARCSDGVPEDSIAALLARINRQMSTYDEASELSQFNRAPVGVAVPASIELATVTALAQQVADRTGGALDVTVAPLVALWGFGARAVARPPDAPEPDAATLRSTRAVVGYRRLEASLEPPRLRKLAPVTLDLSALAKGYAVDRIAALLAASNCQSYLVELGGEVRVRGLNARGQPWRIGIEPPAAGQPAVRLLMKRAGAVATSGDYRQTRSGTDGVRMTHIIDPRTGRPVRHRLASATVVASTAILADAYATALMVLGEADGLAFAERNDLAALLIRRTEGGFAVDQTSAMAAYQPSPLP